MSEQSFRETILEAIEENNSCRIGPWVMREWPDGWHMVHSCATGYLLFSSLDDALKAFPPMRW